jgi:hypothetical protein
MATTVDPRDILWEESFDTYYETYFGELWSDHQIKQWMRIDFSMKFLIAITASGSAVAGLTLWSSSGGKIAWIVMSLIAALASIFQGAAQSGSLIKEHTKSNKAFAELRNELEDFRRGLNLDPQFDVGSKNEEFTKLKGKYREDASNAPQDWTEAYRAKREVQHNLNTMIGDQIQQ